jgi:predicted O-methyltransferase YrrM
MFHALASRFGLVVKKRRPAVPRSASDNPLIVAPDTLMEAIHGCNIYEGFDHHSLPNDPAGWGGQSPAFDELISEIRPKLIFEVGTWKGASALHMAKILDRLGLNDTRILCIDTWLGALEFRSDLGDPDRFLALECHHGYPSVYYRFLANVCHAGQQDRIVPMPFPSSTAALWLLRTNLRADLIYIDGSHEEEDVYQDLIDYALLVQPGGSLLGDDWSWSGVRNAVSRFARQHRKSIDHIHDKWRIRM